MTNDSFQVIANRIVYAFAYLVSVAIFVTFCDVVVFKHLLGYGYPRHYEEEDLARYPVPYVMFTGKPNASDLNELGFRHASLKNAKGDDFKVAFFGGSTGFLGDPTIPQVVQEELRKTLTPHVFVANFSVVSSNHRQHLHAILEYLPQHKPDLVVFYGGYNEMFGARLYDPRPGYPYNFFYRSETRPFQKLLLENSALAGAIDLRFGILSGIGKLQAAYQPGSAKWNQQAEDKYFETLDLASKTAGSVESTFCGHTRFLAFYQPFQVDAAFAPTHADVKTRIATLSYGRDVSSEYDSFGKGIYLDEVHVQQPANDAMGRKIAAIIRSSLLNDNLCPGYSFGQ